MWYYDTERGRCLPFAYGGCGGNDNRFNTEAECTGICSVKGTKQQMYKTTLFTLKIFTSGNIHIQIYFSSFLLFRLEVVPLISR